MELSPTLKGLVEHYSPSGQEADAVNWLVKHMQSLGLQAYPDEAGNAVGIMGNGERQIVLLGHIDTVPGEIEPRLEGDDFYGRGSVDAKGPLAAFVEAAAALGDRPDWQVVVIGAVDEEGDSRGARHVVSRYAPRYAIIGEPSQWQRVTIGYKGTAWANLRLRQNLTHTASAQASVCENAFESWEKIRTWCKDYNADKPRLFEQITPTLRAFRSGGNGFSEWANLRVGVRLPPGFSPADWYQQLDTLFADGADGSTHEVRAVGFPIPAYRADKNTPLVRAFLSAIRKVGGEASFALKTGTADLNIVAPAWGCAAVAYGPGDSSLDHTPHEHISVTEYHQAVQVLKAVLFNLTAE
jgi:LysW-gamma-L-lysine carboxypeptidase